MRKREEPLNRFGGRMQGPLELQGDPVLPNDASNKRYVEKYSKETVRDLINLVQHFQGPKGEKGDKGDKGDRGPQGVAGADGIRGPSGAVGFKGEKGDRGQKGDPGPKGATGPAGKDGRDGRDGLTGPAGPQGPQGIAGAAGTTWFTGEGTPDPGVGKIGDFYLNSLTGDYFQKDRGWVEAGNLKGPPGERGPRGYGGGAPSSSSGSSLTNTDDLDEGVTNLYYTATRVYEKAKDILQAGSNVTITPNDGAETLTIAASGGGGGSDLGIPVQLFWAGAY